MADQSHTSPQTGILAGDKLHLRYNPYAPSNYDSGGFGFGGANGSGGGWGVGGAGPQTGAYGSQANYGQGLPAGDPDTHHDAEETLPESHEGDHGLSWASADAGLEGPNDVEHIRLKPRDELSWDGEDDIGAQDHIVWRYPAAERRTDN